MKKLKNIPSIVVWAIVLVIGVALNFILPGTVVNMYSKMLIMVLFALSLNLQIGYAGMMPLGHSALFGVGAYVYTLMVRADINMPVAVLCAIVGSAVMGLIIGYLCLRGKNGMTFAFLNMGIATLLYTIAIQTTALGRDVGLSGAKRPAFANSTVAFGVLVSAIVIVLVYVIYVLCHSPFASCVTALRDNEERMRFIGINTHDFQLVIYVISSTIAGIAGILYAMFNSGAYPTFINTGIATQAMMMCLIGGMDTFFGPILGAGIVTLIITEVSNFTNYWQAVLGVIIVACVLFFRGGILGTKTLNARKKAQMKKEAEAHE